MNKNKNVQLHTFFYGCLYHFMGLNGIVLSQCLPCCENTEWEKIANALKDYIEKETAYNSKKSIKERVKADTDYLKELSEIYKYVGEKIEHKKYYDENKYPRKFYMYKSLNFTDDQIIGEILPAIFLYMLRSHCSSWASKPINDSMITDSKEALNDLMQADSLLENLIFDLQINEADGLYTPEELVLSRPEDIVMKTPSLLCILKCMIGIFKGNVYKNINFVENALDSYCSALRLYEKSIQLKGDIHNIVDLGSFLCPTVGKCYFEISKLLFDRGRVVDALIYELEAIRYLLALSYEHSDEKGAANPELNDVYKSLYKAKESLDKIRQVSREYFRKDMIMSIFIPSNKLRDMYKYTNKYVSGTGDTFVPILVTESTPLVAPERLKLFTKIISKELKPVVSLTIADILARIGFVLYTIRETIQLERCPKGFQAKKKNVASVKTQNKAILDEIKKYFSGFDGYESELANYTHAFIYTDHAEGGEKRFFSRKIERMFSYALNGMGTTKGEGIERFANKLAKKSLITAGHLSSMPVRMSHYLLQEGYKDRTEKPSFGRTALNKLVVLRRWQSFNPKVPRPRGQDVRGGGYFLFWQGKGIVIDPGYGFIQNFYEEGFSLADIYAIVVTHSHPDHDSELNDILSLLHEWNQMQEMQINAEPEPEPKHIDLFLNEGAYRKYSSWLYTEKMMVKKIYLLQGGRWDKETPTYGREGYERGDANPCIDLKNTYGIEIEVVPAWHDELIDKHSSVGLIFRLYENKGDNKPRVNIGFTGDTERYTGICDNFKDVDILVAHLGDVKIRELLSYTEDPEKELGAFVRNWFEVGGLSKSTLLNLLKDYLINQDIYGLDEEYLDHTHQKIPKEKQIEELKSYKEGTPEDIKKVVDSVKAYCAPHMPFKYANHLGLKGLFDLHESMTTHKAAEHSNIHKSITANQGEKYMKIMVIGELPEELQSYRHLLACILDEHKGKVPVRCLTGDIGLTIGLPTKDIEFGELSVPAPSLAVRCMKCNQNNEYVKGIKKKNNGKTIHRLLHYHAVEEIQEIPLKASNSRIAWFCLKHHASHPIYSRHEFFVEPDLRSVWK